MDGQDLVVQTPDHYKVRLNMCPCMVSPAPKSYIELESKLDRP
ncbi:hypothetical protein MtrunA17_Chr5g0424471 [Medicago truncatula]|uniref:Uncharacterized protein n=1 Tax=Medicago truncatula TaxID=3880 RepID=A0A396HRN7_MEDTR|nr:hypothetical protein MtrunA17_Chr5g0424471 [Medicago truncatula]